MPHPSQTEHAMVTWGLRKILLPMVKDGMTVTITTHGNIARETNFEGMSML